MNNLGLSNIFFQKKKNDTLASIVFAHLENKKNFYLGLVFDFVQNLAKLMSDADF